MSLTDSTPLEIANAASASSLSLARLSANARDDALSSVHDALLKSREKVLIANSIDLTAASKAAESGELSQSLVKRLDLGRKGKFDEMLKGILDVRQLADPCA